MSNIVLVQTVTSNDQYLSSINILFYQFFLQSVLLWRKKLKDFNNLFFQQWYINIWDNRNKWGAKTLSLQRSFQFCVYSFSLLTAEHLFDLDIWWYFKEVYTSLFYFVLTFSGVSKILISRHINLSDFHHWDAPINWRIILEHTLID